MNLVFIRHGEPDYAIDSLTEKGWREAHLLAERLCGMKIDEVYCSPLGRAKDTAKEYLERTGRTAPVLDWLEEFPGNILDPETNEPRIPWDLLPKLWRDNDTLYHKDDWINTDLMQTGSTALVYRRVTGELERFLADHGYVRDGNYFKAVRPNTDTIVFFCHFGIESVLISWILGFSPLTLWQNFVALPTSLTTLSTEEREKGVAVFRCNGFGDLGHLYAGGEPPSFMARFAEIYEERD